MRRPLLAVLAVSLCAAALRADEDRTLTRDEVAVFKKKLVAVISEVARPPAGYAKGSEEFDLPTEYAVSSETGAINPPSAGARRTLTGGGEQAAKKSQKDLEKDAQLRMAEAQARGDYAAMAKLGQEISQQAGQINLQQVQGRKEPIEVNVRLNTSGGDTIDPDNVVREAPGLIALRFAESEDDSKERVVVYFDPVRLKDTKKLSKVQLDPPAKGAAKTTVYDASVELRGPKAELEAMVKKFDPKAVLAQIDAVK